MRLIVLRFSVDRCARTVYATQIFVFANALKQDPAVQVLVPDLAYPVGMRAVMTLANGHLLLGRPQLQLLHLLLWDLLLTNKLFGHCNVANRAVEIQLVAGEQREKERRQLLQVVPHYRLCRSVQFCRGVNTNKLMEEIWNRHQANLKIDVIFRD